ncbi:uncharacterized protein EI90DRAFT_3290716 [Cantharellus anzutake]|uniref:uncharacterized protein n=1 Tax=Cantharellus anzutake TaxID=1750568 RepID=UPI00190422F4|nr:uncharacterized protein EI90DRAFT_3290716 [Cantharellus anzutake]KAF8328225.1 hypothetical protein EI90DRAFT_3290716 [Cantharellus anzutake]
MSTACEHFKNTVVLTAEIRVKNNPDDIAKFRRAILNVKASALSGAEPGALEYRLSQAYNVFSVWAKFADAQAVIFHTRTPAYWDMHILEELMLEGTILLQSYPLLMQDPKVLFYEEL